MAGWLPVRRSNSRRSFLTEPIVASSLSLSKGNAAIKGSTYRTTNFSLWCQAAVITTSFSVNHFYREIGAFEERPPYLSVARADRGVLDFKRWQFLFLFSLDNTALFNFLLVPGLVGKFAGIHHKFCFEDANLLFHCKLRFSRVLKSFRKVPSSFLCI